MSRKLTTLEFIEKAKLIHGNKYDYSLTDYKNARTKVIVICKIHGEFATTPSDHTNHGTGCPICGAKNSAIKRTKGVEKFISDALKIHGNKYNYDHVNYKNKKTKVKIKCLKHGYFYVTPNDHTSHKNGCPKCAGSYNNMYYKNGKALFDTYAKQLIGEITRRASDKNLIEVSCKTCGKFFEPNVRDVAARIQAINGNISSSCNLYCSEECKMACPVFGFHSNSIDPRSKLYIEKTEAEMTRSCQTDIIKQLQCQDDGKLHCERCGNEIYSMDAELHHTYEIHKHGMKASDHETQMLVCVKCHLELHNNCK